MKKVFAAAIAMATLYGSPALAGEPAVGPSTWTGMYIGAHGGYAWVSDSFYATGGTQFGSTTLNPNGGFGGLQVGYNTQIGGTPWVLGSEIDVSWGRLRDTGTLLLTLSGLRDAQAQIDRFGTSRLRIGYAFDRNLVYATGGLAWSSNDAGIISSTREFHGYQVGWAAGAGVEYAIDRHWSAKLEYLHADFGANERPLAPAVPTYTGSKSELSMDLMRVGLNYRFGAPVESRTIMPVKAAAARPLWTGSYIGVHAGYAWLDSTYTDPVAGVSSAFSPKGGFLGFQSGYNWRFAPSLMVGLETDFSLMSARAGGVAANESGHVFGTTDTKIDKMGTIRGRLGFVADRILFYGTGGIAYIHNDVFELQHGTGEPVSGVKGHQLGLTRGGGIEFAINADWSVKTEYLRTEFAKDRFYYSTVTNELTQTMDTVKVGLNYHGLSR